MIEGAKFSTFLYSLMVDNKVVIGYNSSIRLDRRVCYVDSRKDKYFNV